MRKIYLLTTFAGIAFFASMILNPAFGKLLSRLGKREFYVYVVDPGKRTLAKLSSKRQQNIFVYHLPAIDAHGAEKALSFSSHEQLSLDTYVKLYVSSTDIVTAWEEIPTQQLPERIRNGQLR